MPIIKSAIKRAKQANVRRERNVALKRDIKLAAKDFRQKPTSQSLAKAHSELDKAVKKGLLKKNTAARRKSQLSAIAKEAGVKLTPTKKTTTKPAAKSTTTAAKKTTTATKKPAAKKTTSTTAAKKPAAKKTTTK